MIDLEHFPEDPTALRMLSRVSPIYDDAYAAKWLFEVMGRSLTTAQQVYSELPYQAFPETATWGIRYWEQRFGLVSDETLSIEERRRRVIARRNLRAPMNPAKIEKLTTDLTGYESTVTEHNEQYRFTIAVHMPIAGSTVSLHDIYALINGVKPSHLHYGVTADVEPVKLLNTESVRLQDVKFTAHVYNFGTELNQFDARHFFNGKYQFTSGRTKGVRLHQITFSTGIRNTEAVRASLTKDTMYYFDGAYDFNGEKKFNAKRIKEEI